MCRHNLDKLRCGRDAVEIIPGDFAEQPAVYLPGPVNDGAYAALHGGPVAAKVLCGFLVDFLSNRLQPALVLNCELNSVGRVLKPPCSSA